MKIKEICQKTGLTERTIRYYIERGLIHPIAAPITNLTAGILYSCGISLLCGGMVSLLTVSWKWGRTRLRLTAR